MQNARSRHERNGVAVRYGEEVVASLGERGPIGDAEAFPVDGEGAVFGSESHGGKKAVECEVEDGEE